MELWLGSYVTENGDEQLTLTLGYRDRATPNCHPRGQRFLLRSRAETTSYIENSFWGPGMATLLLQSKGPTPTLAKMGSSATSSTEAKGRR